MKYIYLNLIGLLGFIATYIALHYGYFSNINNFVNMFPRTDFLVWIFFVLTDIGGILFITFGTLFLTALLIVRGLYQSAIYTAVAVFGGLTSQTIIKNFLEVSRPENIVVSSFGYSFPSGHTNMITILFLSFCFYVFGNIANRKRRRLYYIISILTILFVGISRVYLNAHWASDVVAGWFLGLFWATAPLVFLRLKKSFTAK